MLVRTACPVLVVSQFVLVSRYPKPRGIRSDKMLSSKQLVMGVRTVGRPLPSRFRKLHQNPRASITANCTPERLGQGLGSFVLVAVGNSS